MLKLKITVTALALVSLDLIIIGDTYLTASAATGGLSRMEVAGSGR